MNGIKGLGALTHWSLRCKTGCDSLIAKYGLVGLEMGGLKYDRYFNENVWTSKEFYKRLTEALPELLETKTGKYQELHRVSPLKSLLIINVKPLSTSIFSNIYYVDKSIINHELRKKGDDINQIPSTNIEQSKTSLKLFFLPIKQFVKDLTTGKNTIAIKKEGDIQLEIYTDYAEQFRPNVIINHRLQTAKVLAEVGKLFDADTDEKCSRYYNKFSQLRIGQFLKGWGVKFDASFKGQISM